MARSQRRQHDRGIGAGDQKVDGAVVDDLEHLFRHHGAQPVVDAGHGVQQNHGRTVDGAAHHTPGGAFGGGGDDAQHQRRNRERSAHNMGDHIE